MIVPIIPIEVDLLQAAEAFGPVDYGTVANHGAAEQFERGVSFDPGGNRAMRDICGIPATVPHCGS